MDGNGEIGFVATRQTVSQNGTGCITLKMLRSTCAPMGTNELPVILNTLKRMHLLDSTRQNIGFPYTFDPDNEGGYSFQLD